MAMRQIWQQPRHEHERGTAKEDPFGVAAFLRGPAGKKIY
jgi:hypothetical protein